MKGRTITSGRPGDSRWTEDYDGQVPCPWCESAETRLVSPYGPSVAEMMFECLGCGQSFGWMKWQQRLPE